MVDAKGNAYVTGPTYSSNFPTTADAYQTVYGGGGGCDAFLAMLNPSGTALDYSTYLGGNTGGNQGGAGIALDMAGAVYVAGDTPSNNFPTTSGAYQAALGGSGASNAFAAKFDAGDFAPTNTPTLTCTPTSTATPTVTQTFTGTLPPTNTPTLTPTRTPTNTVTNSFTPTATATPTPTGTPTQTGTIPIPWTATNTPGGNGTGNPILNSVIYPNPVIYVSWTIYITYTYAYTCPVSRLAIYTENFRIVGRPVELPSQSGTHVVPIYLNKVSGSTLANGLYYFVLTANGYQKVMKVLILK